MDHIKPMVAQEHTLQALMHQVSSHIPWHVLPCIRSIDLPTHPCTHPTTTRYSFRWYGSLTASVCVLAASVARVVCARAGVWMRGRSVHRQQADQGYAVFPRRKSLSLARSLARACALSLSLARALSLFPSSLSLFSLHSSNPSSLLLLCKALSLPHTHRPQDSRPPYFSGDTGFNRAIRRTRSCDTALGSISAL